MSDFVALITIIIWPVVPLFWIPVHGLSKIFKKLGLLTYTMPLTTWLPLAYFIYSQRDFLLQFKTGFPMTINIIGIVLLITGTLLHIWTGKLLGFWGLLGLSEISAKVRSRLVTEGAFSVVRHPTYLAHTLMFIGIFLMTEVIAVGIIFSKKNYKNLLMKLILKLELLTTLHIVQNIILLNTECFLMSHKFARAWYSKA